jgi:flagellar protein FliO/FliZ
VRLRLAGIAVAVGLALTAPPAFAIDPADVSKLDSGPQGPTPAHLSTSGLGDLGRLFFGLIVVIAVIGVAYAILRRASRARLPGRRGGGTLEVLETTPLGPNRNVHLVRVGERVLVIGATDHGITALDAFDREAAIDEGLLAEPTPDELLAEALGPDVGASGRRSFLDTLRDRTSR